MTERTPSDTSGFDQHGGAVDAAVDPMELARLAAEIVAMIEHHREELRVAMAELTTLQRTVRSEIRDAVHRLDRIAAGLPAEGAVRAPEQVDRSTATTGRRRARRS